MTNSKIKTVGQLKKAKYVSKSVRQEMRDNLLTQLKKGESSFPGIIGYEHSVIPQLERAILAGHSINFLGLRGQAKTRMARQMVNLLDEYIPVITGSEINDDPLHPISSFGKKQIDEFGDDCPISWLHRDRRYSEKLATPDVNIADLIGDVDPIKAANLRLSFADEGVIHFGMIPRANRGIFVINELPDLQPRIQVALFNILQEGDIQIRGFQLRFPMDIQFVFTANPEDYTNRGSIITPLKDRIQSQIFTHYPKSIELAKSITKQEVAINKDVAKIVTIPELIEDLIEQIAVEARQSEYVDEKSGVSARLAISAYESLVSSVERRLITNNEKKGWARISDLNAAIPAIVGKIEMVYEGEQEGAVSVGHHLIAKSIRSLASKYFKDINQLQRREDELARKTYMNIVQYFEAGHNLDIINDCSQAEYEGQLEQVDGLQEAVGKKDHLLMEYLLHVLAAHSVLDKKMLESSYRFTDYFSSVMPGD